VHRFQAVLHLPQQALSSRRVVTICFQRAHNVTLAGHTVPGPVRSGGWLPPAPAPALSWKPCLYPAFAALLERTAGQSLRSVVEFGATPCTGKRVRG
jgi:hypothetical protein